MANATAKVNTMFTKYGDDTIYRKTDIYSNYPSSTFAFYYGMMIALKSGYAYSFDDTGTSLRFDGFMVGSDSGNLDFTVVSPDAAGDHKVLVERPLLRHLTDDDFDVLAGQHLEPLPSAGALSLAKDQLALRIHDRFEHRYERHDAYQRMSSDETSPEAKPS